MRILANGLSATSLSGQHVLLGHLAQLAKFAGENHEFLLLGYEGDSAFDRPLPQNVTRVFAPSTVRSWWRRAWWESSALPKILKSRKVDLIFTPTGSLVPGCQVPQVVLAQNPWPYMPVAQRSIAENFKATLLRRTYRSAYQHAALMAYNSQHMLDLYSRDAGGRLAAPHIIAYQGIDDETHSLAAAPSEAERHPHLVLSVSVMAPWKGLEHVARSIATLVSRSIPVHWKIVGPWPHPEYELQIRRLIHELNIDQQVTIAGKVSKDELHRSYREARVFCLMSTCESFGIPAVEAQAFGTPVVGSSVCAMEEIGGAGGLFCRPDQQDQITTHLERLLADQAEWDRYSDAARSNAARFRWELCSQPLRKIFELSQ